MSEVFTCECGRRTTNPYVIFGKKVCVVCAEDEAPDIVERRERRDLSRERMHTVPQSKYGRHE
jgi:hypothetical protein